MIMFINSNSEEHAREESESTMAYISELIARLQSNDDAEADAAWEEIWEWPLEVSVRSGWVVPGRAMVPEEFAILLSTGGPAVRVRGRLNEYSDPVSAWLEYQDGNVPWTACDAGRDSDALLAFCHEFYFGRE